MTQSTDSRRGRGRVQQGRGAHGQGSRTAPFGAVTICGSGVSIHRYARDRVEDAVASDTDLASGERISGCLGAEPARVQEPEEVEVR
jgi:hypothetical protein